MGIHISTGFKRPKSHGSVLPGTIQGGLRIKINNKGVTEFIEQDKMSKELQKTPNQTWWYNYQGNELEFGKYAFKGTYIESILSSTSKRVKQIKKEMLVGLNK